MTTHVRDKSEDAGYSKIVRTAEALSRHNADGLAEGDHVVIAYRGGTGHAFRPTVGCVVRGKLIVGGCLPSPGMTGRRLSQPFRLIGGDDWTISDGGERAILADGTKVLMAQSDRGCSRYSAAGIIYTCIMDAALALTPAVQ